MSFQITEAFVKQFSANVHLLSQQKGSRLADAVMCQIVRGEEFFIDQIGATYAEKLKDRHGDSPIISTPHSRRRGTINDWVWGDMIDKEDRVRTLQDPNSQYVINASYAMGRVKDSVIISCLDATALTGKSGTVSKTLPSTQKVPVGSPTTNLTYEKILQAKTILEDNDVDLEDPMNKPYILCTPYNVMSLLKQTEIKSIDYNTVKALAEGTIHNYMGLEFKVLSRKRVLDDSNGYRRVIVWAKSGVCLGVGADVETNVTKRADKNFNWYAHAKQSIGSARLEEEKVVQILCDETK
jgi:hypothetical protein